MISYGETSGFNEVNAAELPLVNGGKGGGGGGGGSGGGYSPDSSITGGGYTSTPKQDGISVGLGGVTINDGNTTVNVSASGPISSPSVSATVSTSK